MKAKKNVKYLYNKFGDKMCLAPYVQAFYSTTGGVHKNYVRPCSLISGDWSIDGNSLIEARNTTQWKDVRKSFRDGNLHSLCTSCINAEKSGASSPRILANEYLFENFETEVLIDAVQNVIDNNFESEKIYTLDWMPSNYCNFACIMCSGGASSTRRTFEIKKGWNITPTVINEPQQDFLEIVKDVEIMGFTGGETMMQPEVHRFIDYLVENNLAPKMIITILTNASKFPENLLPQFQKFKKVLYTVSIDGVGEVIEYQRRGAVWKDVAANAILINRTPILHSIINHVSSAVNILNAMDFIDWCRDNDIKHIAISQVFQSWLGATVLPPELKKIAWSRLIEGRRSYQHLENSVSDERNWLRSIDKLISIIETAEHSVADLAKFIEHIKNENTESRKPLHEIVPEWAPWFVN